MVEAGSATYTVKLATTDGGGDGDGEWHGSSGVSVDTDGRMAGEQTTLSFTTSNWNTEQTVTVSAADDANTSPETVTLSHSAVALALHRLLANGRPLYVLPVAGAVADVGENISIALLAATYAGAPSSWTRVAAVFTLLKSVLILAALAAVAAGVIRWRWVARRAA